VSLRVTSAQLLACEQEVMMQAKWCGKARIGEDEGSFEVEEQQERV
jgi:hypothetical protein